MRLDVLAPVSRGDGLAPRPAGRDAIHAQIAFPAKPGGASSGAVEPSDAEIVDAVLRDDADRFAELIERHQVRVFACVRRHSRHESEVPEIAQEIFVKAFLALASWRRTAPFEHWLMRLAVRTCYDHLRAHRRNREDTLSSLSDEEASWLERHAAAPESASDRDDAARTLLQRALNELSPAARMVIQLLEIEDRTVREIADLTGWSVPLVKVRAFRARAELKKVLRRLGIEKYL